MSNIALRIDGREVEVAEGHGPRRRTAAWPRHPDALPSREMRAADELPRVPREGQRTAAAFLRHQGHARMVVESETEEVHTARRTALELLFSDHVGDCLSPGNLFARCC